MTMIDPIKGPACGCDGPGVEGLMSVDEALSVIDAATAPIIGTEHVTLAKAQGRVLAEVVRSLGDVPPFDNSAMDGYALNTAVLTGSGPWTLRVVDRIAAGHAPHQPLEPGSATQIFTGAPLPPGANAVVMQEDVVSSAGRITLSKPVRPLAHIRHAGEDMIEGQTILAAGQRLSPRHIAAAAAAGLTRLSVRRPLRVALLVTGDEVRVQGSPRGAAGIWDVNTPMLSAAIASPAVTLCAVEHAADSRSKLAHQLAQLAEVGEVDLVVSTGGISVGEEDHVKPALEHIEGKMLFSGVAIKPGKPVSFGCYRDVAWLGLPGNPLSAFVTWQIFGVPLVAALTGQTADTPARRHVVLQEPLNHKPGRCEMRPARVVGCDPLGREVATCAAATYSGRVATLPRMDGLLLIPAEADTLPTGALVEFQPFHT